MDIFKEAWSTFDPDADNYIKSTDVEELLMSVPPPLGYSGQPNGRRDARKMCLKLDLPQFKGEVAFHDVLTSLVHFSYFQNPKNEERGLELKLEDFSNLPTAPDTARDTARTVSPTGTPTLLAPRLLR